MRIKLSRLASLSVAVPVLLCAGHALAADGAALYKEKCSSCHGVDGKADTPAGKAMKAPPLVGKERTPDEVVKFIRGSDKHKALQKLSDEDLKAIASALPR